AKAFAALATFRHSEQTDTFRGWLHGITRHRLLEHFRRMRRQLAAAGGTDAQAIMLNQPELPPDTDEELLCGQLYRRLLEQLRGEFEQRTWDIFWRSVIDNKPTSTVAREL